MHGTRNSECRIHRLASLPHLPRIMVYAGHAALIDANVHSAGVHALAHHAALRTMHTHASAASTSGLVRVRRDVCDRDLY